MSIQAKLRGMAAAAAFLGLAAPLAAQSSVASHEAEIVVQNNQDEPLSVYLDTYPYEVKIGEVGPFQIAEIPLPERLLDGHERMNVLLLPHGEHGYEGQLVFRDRFDHRRTFGVVVPAEHEVSVQLGPVRIEEILSDDDRD